MKEIWKDIKGYEGLYQVSNLGRIKSLPFKWSPKEKILNPFVLKIGYEQVVFRGKKLYVHRLVAQHFIANPENKPEVNHIDGNKTNNHINNLEWVTKSEQLIHSHRFLNRKKANLNGVNSPSAKLNNLQVRIIRKLEGQMFLREISNIFNINMTTIYRIHKNISYRI